jgi:acetyl-CoA C-acetyltransferase
MGNLTESANSGDREFTREEQDAFSARSHQLAAKAWKDGLFDDEVVPVRSRSARATRSSSRPTRASAPRRRPRAWPGCARPSQGRHHHRRLGLADLRRRRAVVVMSKAKAEELGLTWLAEIGAAGYVAGPDSTLQSQPAQRDPRKACEKEGITPADLDLLELNEAFAAVGLASTQGARRRPRQGQRQRRRDRHGPPGRHVRRPDRAAPGQRAQAPRRRRRRGRPVRRRRPGRRLIVRVPKA